MLRTILLLLLLLAGASEASAQAPAPVAATTAGFTSTGTVNTRHTAETREYWDKIYGCYCFAGAVVKYVTKDVGTPAVYFVKALVKKPTTAEQLLKDARGVVAPWLDTRGSEGKLGTAQRK